MLSKSSKGVVLSDLHLFARRSEGGARFADCAEHLEEARVLVLNGDTFDFRWSALPDHDVSVSAALELLHHWLESWPGLEVHYLLGNHDCLELFVQGLQASPHYGRRLQVHAEALLLGSCVFVHGDCANGGCGTGAKLAAYRKRWAHDQRRSALASGIYAGFDAVGLSKTVHRIAFPQARTVRRVARFLDAERPGWRDTAKDCFFGHTHLACTDHLHEGIRFHNTGSGIHGMEFNPLTFTLEP